MSKFKDDLKLLGELQGLIDEAKKTANPPDYAKDVFGAISPVLKKVMPAARMRAVHQIDVLTRAKARLEELISCWHLSFWERLKLLFTGRLWFSVIGNAQPPIWLGVDCPFI